MKKFIVIIAFANAIILSGCLPAVFVAGATAGGVVICDRRTVNTMFEDKKITCKALAQLTSEPHLKENSHISVATFNRVVLLVGQARTTELRHRAYELVQAVPNIRRINNEIIIAPPLSPKECSTDIWLTTKVKTAMVAEKGLNSTQIKVLSDDSVVYLLGLVTHEQADIATNVARQVNGVMKVVTLFEYTQ